MHCNPLYPNKILTTTMLDKPLYLNLTFSVTTKPSIINLPYLNLIANTSIWTIYKGSISKCTISTPASNN